MKIIHFLATAAKHRGISLYCITILLRFTPAQKIAYFTNIQKEDLWTKETVSLILLHNPSLLAEVSNQEFEGKPQLLIIMNVSSFTSHKKTQVFTTLRLSFRAFMKFFSNSFIYELILIKVC